MLIGDPRAAPRADGSGRAVAPEAPLVRFLLGVIALAIADDAVLHPEAGSAAGDHLVSRGCPLAVAIGLALVYPRLRAGARASAALACGALAIVAGATDGIGHAVVDRVSGDHATAVLAGLAGIALVVIGAVVLWRSRRLDERHGRHQRADRRVAARLQCCEQLVERRTLDRQRAHGGSIAGPGSSGDGGFYGRYAVTVPAASSASSETLAPRGTTITGHAASRITRPDTAPSRTAWSGP
jgi:hypothetical protein